MANILYPERRAAPSGQRNTLPLLASLFAHGLTILIAGMISISIEKPSHSEQNVCATPLTVSFVPVQTMPVVEVCDASEPPRQEPIDPSQFVAQPKPEQGDDARKKSVFSMQDDTAGGTSVEVRAPAAGGGGGDDVVNDETGHVHTTPADWARIKVNASAPSPAPNVVGAGSDGGKLPGLLSSAGSGHGHGNGEGSGALGATGSGTGSRSGVNGSGQGDGRGKSVGVSSGVRGIRLGGGSYPTEARRARHEGVVTLTVEVLSDGNVGAVRLAHSSGYSELDEAALSAAQNWRFEPAVQDGKAVISWVNVPYQYILH